MFAMAQIWNIPGPQRPGYLRRLGRSGLFLLGLLIGVVATTGLASLSAFGHQNPGIIVAADALAVAVNVGMFMFAFRVLTPKGIPGRDLVPGAIVAGIGWTAPQTAGALVIKHYLTSESVYHIFAIVLALIAWIYLLVQLMLYSAELNIVMVRRLYPRSMLQPPLTEADSAARSSKFRSRSTTAKTAKQHPAALRRCPATSRRRPTGRESNGAMTGHPTPVTATPEPFDR
jgi:uncharacterized BrkB/YihY/UPF0761 family membrane protein